MSLLLSFATFSLLGPARLVPSSARTPPPRGCEAAQTAPGYAPAADNEADVWERFPRSWVPIASEFELDPERPTPALFLGRNYVVWQDNDGEWRVMPDACPHRLAPLSEGRIDRTANRIECAYHGWAFDAQGKCKMIPQMEGTSLRNALASPRSCIDSLPVAVHKSIIFAWPWGGVPTLGTGEGTPEAMLAGVADSASTYTRDLPYGWDSLVENIIDPGHVPWAHHGLQGKREDALPINMTMLSGADDQSGFSFEFQDRTMGKRRSGMGQFRAPYVVSYDAEFETLPGKPPSRPFKLTVVCIPTQPGWSRAIIFGFTGGDKKPKRRVAPLPPPATAKVEAEQQKRKTLISRVFGLFPVWFIHTLSSRFLDSDLAFLHYQEKELGRRQPKAVAQAYFMPAAADQPIDTLRQWLSKHAPVLGPLPSRIRDRSVLLDRWTQHSSHCYHCNKAASNDLPLLRKRTVGVLAISLLAGVRLWPARLVSAACVLAIYSIGKAEQLLRFQDYRHYENH